ncbi:Cysteine protease atg4c [Pycnococcus provasolii]|uniref:Cysteine protease n=1 Tax=Pycnococcus provasolii TaxID=41880 RepID=A0A830HA45_9CHLO|nr:Cysteine protease atg4c [Pycnococcus provasolii]
MSDAEQERAQTQASTGSSWRSSLYRTYYTLKNTLMDPIEHITTTSAAHIVGDIHVLGTPFRVPNRTTQEQAQQLPPRLLAAWSTKLTWCTYRHGFPTIETLTTDAGWGCTIRSAQMLIAHVLLSRCPGTAQQIQQRTAWFDDTKATDAPLSLHSLCRRGQLQPGQWAGPRAVCAAVQRCLVAIAEDVPGSGVPGCHVLSIDGGIPTLRVVEVKARIREGAGLLLLVPLMLGMGNVVNETYLPALATSLSLAQSVGAVGGRGGSSLYFAGCAWSDPTYAPPPPPPPPPPSTQPQTSDEDEPEAPTSSVAAASAAAVELATAAIDMSTNAASYTLAASASAASYTLSAARSAVEYATAGGTATAASAVPPPGAPTPGAALELLYLDPHTLHACVVGDTEDFMLPPTPAPKRLRAARSLNPSISLGFYVRDESDLANLVERLDRRIVTVVDSDANEGDPSSSLLSEDEGGVDANDDDDDDDDFVLV